MAVFYLDLLQIPTVEEKTNDLREYKKLTTVFCSMKIKGNIKPMR